MGLRSAVRRLEAAFGAGKPCPTCGHPPGAEVEPEIKVVWEGRDEDNEWWPPPQPTGRSKVKVVWEGEGEDDEQADKPDYCPECGRQLRMLVQLTWTDEWPPY